MTFKAGKPTHRLKAKRKSGNDDSTVLGAAWLCEDGSFTIRLGPCVVISASDDVFLKLFPIEEKS